MRSTKHRSKNLARGLIGFGLMLFAMAGACLCACEKGRK